MKKFFHFDTPGDVYTADAVVVTCYDARFDAAVRKFLKRRGLAVFDHIKIAGRPKRWRGWRAERDFVLRMVRISLALHHPPRAILIAHNDCGAYPADAGRCRRRPAARRRFPSYLRTVVARGVLFRRFRRHLFHWLNRAANGIT